MASNQESETGDAKNQARCLVCGGTLARSHLPGLLQCGACGFITADLHISDEEHKALYGPGYFHGEEYSDYVLEEESLKENFRRRLRTVLEFMPDSSGKNLFEIGCAYGFFLDLAKDHFAAVAGIDIAAAAVAHARDKVRVDVVAGDFLSHGLARPPDLVCLWDVIEHLKHPGKVLAKVSETISPGGLVAITTGDIASLNARIRGRRWRMIHPPTHLHYFSRATLGRLLDGMGFDVIHVEYPGVTRTLGQIFYGVLVLRHGMPGLYRAFERLPVMDWKIGLNLFDIMFVIARKRTN